MEAKSDPRLNFRDRLCVSTLIQASRQILHERQMTRLSEPDRQLFVAMLDDQSTQSNEALKKAAKRYKKQVG